MAEKTKQWWLAFVKGFTIFHAVGTVCVFLGFYIGDVPETILKRSEKLVQQVKDIKSDCTVIDRATKHKICFTPAAEFDKLIGVARSLGEDAKKIIGSQGELNAGFIRVPFRVTGSQILGILIFFFGTLNSILKSRFGGKENK